MLQAIMLKAAGSEKQFKEINLKAINSALNAREETKKMTFLLRARYPIAIQ